MIAREAWAIVWAQWRSLANYHGKSRASRFPFALLFGLIWYGFWAFVAIAVGLMVSEPENIPLLRTASPTALLLQMVYWQIVPIMMVSTGVSLDLARLMVYPIPHVQLFTIEVLLRVTTSLEMLLISFGIAGGILVNPQLPWTGIVAILVFAAFNLLVSAGIKDLLGRLLVRKGFREAMVLIFVLLAALPQVLLMIGTPQIASGWFQGATTVVSPWVATSTLAFRRFSLLPFAALAVWTVAAWLFGRNQFERTLRFDTLEAKARGEHRGNRRQLIDVVARFLSKPFRDPFGVLLDKEIRFLSRSARFRLLFLMGFSFGLLIWLPMAIRRDSDSFISSNYLTVASAYALMLLGEICFWNNLGLDRGAAQAYFVMPTSVSTVLRAKNLAAMLFILLEVAIVSMLCTLLQMPVDANDLLEAISTTIVFGMFLLSFGNLLSVRHPRPVDPAQSWRSGSMGRAQAYLLFLYPVAAAPIGLAFGARFAFESELAFYGVLLVDLIIGIVFYVISLESAERTAAANKEDIILALSKAEGPAAS